MDTIKWLLTVDPNYINIILITIFFSLEQFIDTPFKFKKRGQHLFHNILMQLSFLVFLFLFHWNQHAGYQ